MEPTTYVKDGRVRVVDSAASRVNAEWEGFVPKAEQSVDDVDYRDLQEQAKALGVPANQSKAALVEAVADAKVDPGA